MTRLAHESPDKPTTAPRDRGISGVRLALAGVVFCVSGSSALIYQVAWQRILALHSGVGVYSVSVIVAAFLSGLGIGSYIGGVLSARVRPSTALKVFAALELGIALFAAISCAFYYEFLLGSAHWLYASLWTAAPAHFLALALPTVLMGMSLPFLVRATVDHPHLACRTIGFLYGINVAGSAIGALLTPWVLIRFFGVQGAVNAGAIGNLFAGLCALAIGFTTSEAAKAPAAGSAGADAAGASSRMIPGPATPSCPFHFWIALYSLSGFCALALEILWFRIIDVAVKSTAFTFGTVLAMFLAGIAAGSIWGGRRAVRESQPLRAFLRYQSIIIVYAGAAIFALLTIPVDWPLYRELMDYWRQFDVFALGSTWDWKSIGLLYLLLPLFLLAVPTILMGLSFGVLQRAVQNDRQTSGRKAGFLQAGNIAGNVAGSLVMGLAFLNWFGTATSLKVLLALGLAFPLLGFFSFPRNRSFAVFAAMIVILILVLPGGASFWKRIHGVTNQEAFFAEDAAGVVAITPTFGHTAYSRHLKVNGRGHSWFPFGGPHTQLGAVAAIVHPDPAEIAIIGLGSGDTAWSAGCREETRRIDVFELCSAEERLLRRISGEAAAAGAKKLLADPRVSIINADGRNALTRLDRRYDIIEADALRPTSAYAGNLYSEEFFRICASRLKPGGMMCQWAATPRVMRSFRKVFPYIIYFPAGPLLVGSNTMPSTDRTVWQARLASPAVSSYLGSALAHEIRNNLHGAEGAWIDALKEHQSNQDLFPRDEFLTPPGR